MEIFQSAKAFLLAFFTFGAASALFWVFENFGGVAAAKKKIEGAFSVDFSNINWALFVGYLVSIATAFVIFHKTRIQLVNEEQKRREIMYQLGVEMHSGISKCINFLQNITFDVISTHVWEGVAKDFLSISKSTTANLAARRIYEMFLTINHNFYLGREGTASGWAWTYTRKMLSHYDEYIQEYNRTADKRYEFNALPLFSNEEREEVLRRIVRLEQQRDEEQRAQARATPPPTPETPTSPPGEAS